MTNELNVFFSNHLDILYLNLKKNLFTDSAPFARRLVIVYGPAMKAWLMLKIAQDPDFKVVLGIEFIYLNQAFEALVKILNPTFSYRLPSYLDLSLSIENEIIKNLSLFKDLTQEEKLIWLPLIYYFKLDPFPEENIQLTKKLEKRLTTLSQHLAKHFLNYSRFAGVMTTEWEKNSAENWQQVIWKNLFGSQTGLTSLTHALQEPVECVANLQIHFFSISFLSQAEFAFIAKISESVPTSYYLISPCAVFWSDIRSDRESRFLQSFFEKQFGQFSPQVEQLEELLRDRNPLLANFGRIGREMLTQIEESPAIVHANYTLPAHIEPHYDIAFCENLYLYTTTQPLTLLHAVQADMLLMRSPQEEETFNFELNDRSIQLHKTPNRRREIEVLYHNLLDLMNNDSLLEPQHIIVMAPQIHDYIPYIKSIFGSESSQIDFQILDLGSEATSEMVQTFLLLLKLSECRWDVGNLLQLFEQPSFQRKSGFTQADSELIREWINQAGICWGDDLLHRNDLLKRVHCRLGMADETSVGTWDYGLSRLLLGLTNLLNTHSAFPLDTQPCGKIEFTDTELLSKWIKVLHSLRDDLTLLHDHTKMTIEDWSFYFKSLLINYLQPDYDSASILEEWNHLQTQIDLLGISIRACKTSLFPFHSVHVHLKNLLEQNGIIYRENYLQTVRFCSLIPLRSIPAKAIAFLGMQAEVFPRMEEFSSLNLASTKEKTDYLPSTVDYDRFLFLEALHSTRDYLLISYQGYEQNENKEQTPSIVVEELFSYLDRYYTINNKLVSTHCRYAHPLDAFDKSYFISEKNLCNFSSKDYLSAQIFYETDKQQSHVFISHFETAEKDLSEIFPTGSVIDLKHLTEAAKHPVKFHLNRILEIYLEDNKDRILKKEEDLKISSLDKYMLKRNGLKYSLEKVLYQAEKEGKLPFGLFKTVAVNHLTEDIEKIQNRLQKESVSQEEIYQFEFCLSTQVPLRLPNNRWRFPAIQLNFSTDHHLFIVGTLSHATPKGLFAFAKDNLEEMWKLWPQFLAYQYACQWCPNKFEKKLILSEKQTSKIAFFDDPDPYLKKFIRYYARCRQHFSPLMPEWLDDILKKDIEGLQKGLNQIYEESFGAYRSQDLKWAFNRYRLPHAQELLNGWENEAEDLLADLKARW